MFSFISYHLLCLLQSTAKEKELMHPLYDRYRQIKQILSRFPVCFSSFYCYWCICSCYCWSGELCRSSWCLIRKIRTAFCRFCYSCWNRVITVNIPYSFVGQCLSLALVKLLYDFVNVTIIIFRIM